MGLCSCDQVAALSLEGEQEKEGIREGLFVA